MHISHAGGAGVCIGISGLGAEKAVVAAPGLYSAGLVNFPTTVTVGAVIEIYLVLGCVVVQPWLIACKFC
jgi:hypothetical protein